jgi:hypothetical protein
MTTEPTETDVSLTALDALPTEELRERAFAKAWHHHDLNFFVTVIRILPASEDTGQLDGSLGSFGASLSDIVSIWREFTGHGYGENEPMIRAEFIDYLMKK